MTQAMSKPERLAILRSFPSKDRGKLQTVSSYEDALSAVFQNVFCDNPIIHNLGANPLFFQTMQPLRNHLNPVCPLSHSSGSPAGSLYPPGIRSKTTHSRNASIGILAAESKYSKTSSHGIKYASFFWPPRNSAARKPRRPV